MDISFRPASPQLTLITSCLAGLPFESEVLLSLAGEIETKRVSARERGGRIRSIPSFLLVVSPLSHACETSSLLCGRTLQGYEREREREKERGR